jgi:Dockerin type I domain
LKRAFCILVILGAIAYVQSASSQIVVAPQPQNQFSANISGSVSFDPAAQLYTYNYQITNAGQSVQEIWLFSVEFSGDVRPDITNPKAPQGWTYLSHSDRPDFSWAATDVGTLPTNYIDDGNIPPSPFQIKPGRTLNGFSFQSSQPPTNSIVYLQGFAPLPQVRNDVGELPQGGAEVKDFADNSIILVVSAPRGFLYNQQNLKPAIDGFFTVVGPRAGSAVSSPLTISVKFSLGGETVNRSSFSASLNGNDVTSRFSSSQQSVDLAGSFTVNDGFLVSGPNLLLAEVSGTDPNTSQTVTKLRRVPFFVNVSGKTDVNGDGRVDCTDLTIVKASFGMKTGQTGFDPRADVNGDGIINVLDLSAVAKQLPAGTVCK